MRTLTSNQLRRNLASEIEKVNDDHEPLIITRGKGKPQAVLISLEDFNAYEETSYLLSSPKNAERLRRSIGDFSRSTGSNSD